MPAMHRQGLLATRPQGAATPANFRLVEAPIPRPAEGEVLVRNEWLSLDPYMRGRMNDAKSYVPPAALGAVIVGLVRSLAVHYLPQAELFVIYLVMALVLAFRPRGLFSIAEARKI